MKHRLNIFLAIMLFLFCLTSCVSAFTLSSVNVNPPGYQAAGTPMAVTFVIGFPVRGTETFPPASELRMSTNLTGAYWVPVLVLDGVETRLPPQTGSSLELPGGYLSYPSTQNVQVWVNLTGTMPATHSPGRHFLKIEEVDSGKSVVSSARVEMPETPFIPLSTPSEKPTTVKTTTKKPVALKTFTPIPTATPSQDPPLGAAAGIIAAAAAVLVMKRR